MDYNHRHRGSREPKSQHVNHNHNNYSDIDNKKKETMTNSMNISSSSNSNGNVNNPSATLWTTFFANAGIPMNLANEYSLIFTKHRIRGDMLNELNREILSDMGIKAMGDIIAILRQAKSQVNLEEVGKCSIVTNTIASSHNTKQIYPNSEKETQNKMMNHNNNHNNINNNNKHTNRNFIDQPAQRASNTTYVTKEPTTTQNMNRNVQSSGGKIKSRLSMRSGALRVGVSNKPNSSATSRLELRTPIRSHSSGTTSSSIKSRLGQISSRERRYDQ